jgi:homoserine O-succinyltransferase/O-acetyltransferase
MLTIGLVNNMPPAAIESTERQFREVLNTAAMGMPFTLRWFRLVGLRPAGYEPTQALWGSRLDGLIITGAEPKAPTLPEEAVWPSLTRLIDWAAENTVSTIFSCLAAHAAVHYLDGIERQPHAEKIFGVFESRKLTEHPLLHGTPDTWHVPHSRWNDLPEQALRERGYDVLTRSNDAGVDLFTKQVSKSLFFFIQTHPEYFPVSLLREWWRDVQRFRNKQQDRLPSVPRNYIDQQYAAAVLDLEDMAEARQMLETLIVPEGWRPVAIQLYRNWLLHLQHGAMSAGAMVPRADDALGSAFA